MKAATLLAIFCIAAFAQQKGTFTDTRDGKTYKTTKIGEQVWFAENLNYKVNGSRCGGGDDQQLTDKNTKYCIKYGRLYDWATAKKVCPSGWHLPSAEEWETLIDFAGDSAAVKLRAKGNIWNDIDNCDACGRKILPGLDSYGFSALPGGQGSDNIYFYPGFRGYWWSITEYNANKAQSFKISDHDIGLGVIDYNKTELFSVRCIRN